MKLLVLGGTQFIGRHIAETLLAAGHAVSVFNRGQAPDALPAGIERLRGDRDAGAEGLQALAGRRWDACIDVSGYTPRQVLATTDALHAQIARYIYVSAVMVYGDPAQRPVTEDQPRVAPAGHEVTEIEGHTYGPLKVACEDIVRQRFHERATLLRPQVVVGPHDPSGRYAHWVQRAALPGPMLAPGDGSDHLQVIDVRDLARFVRTVAERGLAGAFNLAGPRLSWRSFIALLDPAEPVWVPADLLREARLHFTELPLYRPEHGERASLMHVDASRALAAGLRLTPPADTLRDVRASLAGREAQLALPPVREAALIAQARARDVV